MPNTQPLFMSPVTTQGTVMDLCALLDTARSTLGTAMRSMQQSANVASGGILLMTSAKSALVAAMKETSRATKRLDQLIFLCYAAHDLEQDPSDSLTSLALSYNDTGDDAPDPYAASNLAMTVTPAPGEDAGDTEDTQPHATITEEPSPAANHTKKGS